MLLPIVIYFIACLLLAVLGRNTIAGPVGFFILALLVTPLIAYFFLLMSTKRGDRAV